MNHLAYVELAADKAKHNIGQFRDFLADGVQVAAVVKGNAYGHGMPEMVRILEESVDCWQVDDLLELRELRRHSSKRTLVLGYVAQHELEEALALGGELAIYDTERLPLIAEHPNPRLHLKIDT